MDAADLFESVDRARARRSGYRDFMQIPLFEHDLFCETGAGIPLATDEPSV